MPSSVSEQLALIAEQEAGIRKIIASCEESLMTLEDKGSRAAESLRELIALNEDLLAQFQGLRVTLNSFTERERDILNGVGPPPTHEELWGRKHEA